MTTAIDTNILMDILVPNPRWNEASAITLSRSGALIISDVVYAELGAHFAARESLDEFLESLDIRVEPLNRQASYLAGRAWRAYRKRGGRRERILPDFLIGAHAQMQASRLLTRDRGFYRELFPDLVIIEPAAD
jgi:hypothetical protein